MIKLALIVLGILGLSVGSFYLVYLRSNVDSQPQITENLREVPKTLSEEDRAYESTESSSQNSTPIPKPNGPVTLSSLSKDVESLRKKIDELESANQTLTSKVNALDSGSSTATTQTSSSSSAPQYIYALGNAGSTTKTDWTEITSLTITIDPSLYKGYKNMKLEAFMRVKDGNGKAYARLYSGGVDVIPSEVSTGSYQNTWVSSGNFTLSGSKTYTFRVKSLTGYEAFIENARVVVSY